MKKIIFVLFTIIFAFGLTFVSLASSGSSVTISPVKFKAEDNSITVTGFVKSQRDRIPMSLYISSGDDVIAAGKTLAVGTSDDGVPFAFEPIKLGYGTKSGEFTIEVTADFVDDSNKVTYTYNGMDKQFEAVKALQKALEDKDKDDYILALDTHSEALGVNFSEFEALKDARSYVVASLMTRSYTLPDGYDTKEKCKIIQTEIGKFTAHFNEAMAIGEFFAANSQTIVTWYENYKTEYKLLLDDTDTVPDESKMVSYFESVYTTNGYLEDRSNIKSALSMKELNIAIKHCAILESIAVSGQYVVIDVLEDFPGLLTGVDYSEFNKLSESQKAEVALDICGNSYETIALLCSAINDAVDDAASGSGKDSSGGSSGKRGSHISVGSDVITPAVKPVMQFTDIEHVAWAHDAIRYLYSEGIISGRNEQIFAPDDNITRAELTKLLVEAFDLNAYAMSAVSFGDVNPSSWYAPYVNAASQNGLVLGDDMGNFNPDAPVTRQDAAVIMYRVIKNSQTFGAADFVDYDTISPYAKEAVDYMSSKGIINGVGDGIFAPHGNLTRAAASNMLYKMLVG